MKAKQPVEEIIDRRLRSLGLAEFGAAFFEAVAPVAFVGAQLAYLLDPLFSGPDRTSWLAQLAVLMERPDQLEGFIDRLREESE